MGSNVPRSPLHGVFEVVGFSRENEELAKGDPSRWQQVRIEPSGFLLVFSTDGRQRFYRYEAAPSGAALSLRPSATGPSGFAAPAPAEADKPGFELELVWNDAEHLDLAGELEGELIVAQMKKRTFLPETRGYHWINEQPFNR
jgi:hypothetical protein